MAVRAVTRPQWALSLVAESWGVLKLASPSFSFLNSSVPLPQASEWLGLQAGAAMPD